MNSSMISTHVLDLNSGNPAQTISVSLEKKSGSSWKTLETQKTNSDGRIKFSTKVTMGSYRLHFHLKSYLKRQKSEAFFPEASVVFVIKDTKRNYHIPLLLNKFGYSTYRGS